MSLMRMMDFMVFMTLLQRQNMTLRDMTDKIQLIYSYQEGRNVRLVQFSTGAPIQMAILL
jgi:hypothetical protein